MYQKIILSVLLLLSTLFIFSKISYAQEQEGEIIIISERVGEVIDLEERTKFDLFGFVKGFQSARLFKLYEGSCVWKISLLDSTAGELVIRENSPTEPEINRLREYIDNFEQIQAGKYQIQFEQEDSLQIENQPSIRIQSKPFRERRTFPITEFGVNYRLTSSPTIKETNIHDDEIHTYTNDYNTTFYITSDLGLMKNMSSSYSLGASNFLGLMFNEFHFKGGLKFRIRRWLSKGSSIDLSPGVLLWETSEYYKTPGFTGSLDFKIEEWFALTLTFEYLRSQYYKDEGTYGQHYYSYSSDPEDDIAVYLGLKSGSKTGLKATITAVGAFLLFLVLFWLYPGD
jgi:hypothetical protein